MDSKKARIWTWVGAAVWIILIAVFMSFDSTHVLGLALLAASVVIVLGWVAVEVGYKRWRRKRQNAFDENLAAREGIEDRKREWATWTEELQRQGIDRYQLPFYLLVGEPQGGKSILLHNSELRFPFGQSRLSGLGGTRGCDWWFTNEAVILDVAGRLFTHEGGSSDSAEWEAFLDLLVGYRPLEPASGILLVLPCDSLLSDSPETTTEKARRIQDTLLTLANKLQAEVPVYVVLTKADKILGFAESVHRLDGKQQLQMFGWSRPAGLVESPFSQAEVREGYDTLIQRARTLRSNMVSTAQIPEALGEVDRLFAFPEELEALWPSVDRYLTQIFAESSLVDRLFFRGIYLTSGLQSGAPIARACAELLGDSAESDQRELEAIFSRQRAYFIRDLIKDRVFGERTLVRPTARRLKAARKRQWIAYGVAASATLISLVGAGWYVFQQRGSVRSEVFAKAIEDAGVENVVLRPDVDYNSSVPDRLQRVERALESSARSISSGDMVFETGHSGPVDEFERLYSQIFDTRYVPYLRRIAEHAVVQESGELRELSHPEFLERVEDVTFLIRELDPDSKHATARGLSQWETLVLLAGRAPEFDSEQLADSAGRFFDVRGDRDQEFDSATYSGLRGHPESSEISLLARRIEGQLDSLLEPNSPHLAPGAVGFFAALREVERLYGNLSEGGLTGETINRVPEFQGWCSRYHSAALALQLRLKELPGDRELGGKHFAVRVDKEHFASELVALRNTRFRFLEAWSADEFEEVSWAEGEALRDFADEVDQATGGSGFKGLILGVVPSFRGNIHPRSLGRQSAVALSNSQESAEADPDTLIVEVERVRQEYLETDLLNLCDMDGIGELILTPFELKRSVEGVNHKLNEQVEFAALQRARETAAKTYLYTAGEKFLQEYNSWQDLCGALGGTCDDSEFRETTPRFCKELSKTLQEVDPALLGQWINRLEQLEDGWNSSYSESKARATVSDGEASFQLDPSGRIPWEAVKSYGSNYIAADAQDLRLQGLLNLYTSAGSGGFSLTGYEFGEFSTKFLQILGEDHEELEEVADSEVTPKLEGFEAYWSYLDRRDQQLLKWLERHEQDLTSIWSGATSELLVGEGRRADSSSNALSEAGIQAVIDEVRAQGVVLDFSAAGSTRGALEKSETFYKNKIQPLQGANLTAEQLANLESTRRLKAYAEVLEEAMPTSDALRRAYGEVREEAGDSKPWSLRLQTVRGILDSQVVDKLIDVMLDDFGSVFLAIDKEGARQPKETIAWRRLSNVLAWRNEARENWTSNAIHDDLREGLVTLFSTDGLYANFKARHGWGFPLADDEDEVFGVRAKRRLSLEGPGTQSRRDAWDHFVYFEEFMTFLHPPESESEGAGGPKMTITFEIVDGGGISDNSVWDAGGKVRWNKFSYSPKSPGGSWSIGDVVGGQREFTIPEWSLFPQSDLRGNQNVRIRWQEFESDRDGLPEEQERIVIPGSLAPVLMVWSFAHGNGEGLKPRKVWRIRVPVTLERREDGEPATFHADFKVTFERPVPLQPVLVER